MLRPGAPAVTYRLLGSLEAWRDGRVVELGPRKQRAVLAVLLLHAGEIVSSDRLVELVWGDAPPRTAAHSIQIYVHYADGHLSYGSLRLGLGDGALGLAFSGGFIDDIRPRLSRFGDRKSVV